MAESVKASATTVGRDGTSETSLGKLAHWFLSEEQLNHRHNIIIISLLLELLDIRKVLTLYFYSMKVQTNFSHIRK